MQSYPSLDHETIKSSAEGVSDLQYSDILPSHFCWSVVGAPGSGKTTFIQQILSNDELYKDKFDYIIITSPSPITIDNVDKECISPLFNIQWIYDKLNYISAQNIKNKNILVILDDCVSDIKKQQNDVQLQQLFFNRRHIIPKCTISILLTAQQFMMIPSKFRSVCDPFTFLSLTPRDVDQIKRELVYHSNHKHLQDLVSKINQQHHFIYIRQHPSLMCLDFKPIVQGHVYVAQSNDFQSIARNKQLQQEISSQEERMPLQRPPIQSNQFNSQQNLKFFTFKK